MNKVNNDYVAMNVNAIKRLVKNKALIVLQ